MPTEILRPDGAGFATGVAFVTGAASHYLAVDEVSPDDDSSYIASTGNNGVDYFILDPSSIPVGAIINSVTVHWRARWGSGSAGAQVTPGLRLGGVDSDGTATATATSSYANYSQVISRPGGGSWALADLANLELKLRVQNSTGGQSNRVTQTYVVVDYTNAIFGDAEVSVGSAVTANGQKQGRSDIEIAVEASVSAVGEVILGPRILTTVEILAVGSGLRSGVAATEAEAAIDIESFRYREAKTLAKVSITAVGFNPASPPPVKAKVRLVLL